MSKSKRLGELEPRYNFFLNSGAELRLFLFLVSLALLLGACRSAPDGFLEGKVTVGPLTPVQQAGVPTPMPPPEVFISRSLNVFKQDGKTLMKHVPIQADGTYRVELPPGTYVVDIEHTGIDSAAGLPASVVIRSNEVTRLDVDIDTGIR